MSERNIMDVVRDIRRYDPAVELQILVDELVILVADLQAKADQEKSRRESNRVRMALVRAHKRCVQHTNGKSPTPPRIYKNKKNNPPSPLEGFQNWYEAYPRREARRAAEKAYRQSLARGNPPESLLSGAKRYAREVAGREPQFIKTPAAWLNADCHLDEGAKVLSFRPGAPQRTWAEIKAEKEKSQ